jgi:hypothetical protein
VFCSEVPGLLHAGFAGHELMHQVQAQHVGRLCITPPGHLTPGPIDQDAGFELQDQMGQLRRDAVVDVLPLLLRRLIRPQGCGSAHRVWWILNANDAN